MTKNNQKQGESFSEDPIDPKTLFIVAIVIMLITVSIVIYWVIDRTVESTVTGCTVTHTEINPPGRRSLSYLIVETSCGDYISRNRAHRVLIEENHTYNFNLTGTGWLKQPKEIVSLTFSK